MRKNQIKKPFYKQPFSLIVFILLVIYSISFLLPFFWGIMASLNSYVKWGELKPAAGIEYSASELWAKIFALPTATKEGYSGFSEGAGMITSGVGFDSGKNYLWALTNLRARMPIEGYPDNKVGYVQLMLHSFVYAFGGTLISTFSHAVTAYVAARYSHHKPMRLFYPIVIITMILPIVGSLPSELQMMIKLDLYNNVVGLLMMKGSFLGTNFLIFYACFKGISWEYAEAAFVDGASHFRVLVQIMLPLAAGTLGALALISFITYWNDWQVNLVYIPDNWPMIAYSLYDLCQAAIKPGELKNVPRKMAAAIIIAVPLVILFIIFRKNLMSNLTIGGLKG